MPEPRARILLVEDELNMVRTLSKILERRGFAVATALHGEEALAYLEREPVDIIITDLHMPVMHGMKLLRHLAQRAAMPTTVVLTGHGTIPSAVEAMKLGAADYLIKPCHPDELILVIERLLEVQGLRREVRLLKREVERYHRFGELIGTSPAMQEIYGLVDAVSHNKSNVLILGESGTGKELIARYIHRRGPLADLPFVPINCGAMSETLLDSQLFGHRKGSFTGAIADQEGLFEAANGGTLFLDEVSEIPLGLQVKFLRAIQEREVTPIGSTRPVKVDVRIITATQKDLAAEVSRGTFRADLYYRLNVVTMTVPPLRERREDIPLLIEHFIREFSEAYKVEPKHITAEALEWLMAYDWPGNVRELQNAIERAFALSPSASIAADMLPAAVRDTRLPPTAACIPERTTAPADHVVPLEEAERQLIEAALAQSGGNKNAAARILGIDRQRLYRKMGKYGLK